MYCDNCGCRLNDEDVVYDIDGIGTVCQDCIDSWSRTYYESDDKTDYIDDLIDEMKERNRA